jgi:hypothetical protein
MLREYTTHMITKVTSINTVLCTYFRRVRRVLSSFSGNVFKYVLTLSIHVVTFIAEILDFIILHLTMLLLQDDTSTSTNANTTNKKK